MSNDNIAGPDVEACIKGFSALQGNRIRFFLNTYNVFVCVRVNKRSGQYESFLSDRIPFQP